MDVWNSVKNTPMVDLVERVKTEVIKLIDENDNGKIDAEDFIRI